MTTEPIPVSDPILAATSVAKPAPPPGAKVPAKAPAGNSPAGRLAAASGVTPARKQAVIAGTAVAGLAAGLFGMNLLWPGVAPAPKDDPPFHADTGPIPPPAEPLPAAAAPAPKHTTTPLASAGLAVTPVPLPKAVAPAALPPAELPAAKPGTARPRADAGKGSPPAVVPAALTLAPPDALVPPSKYGDVVPAGFKVPPPPTPDLGPPPVSPAPAPLPPAAEFIPKAPTTAAPAAPPRPGISISMERVSSEPPPFVVPPTVELTPPDKPARPLTPAIPGPDAEAPGMKPGGTGGASTRGGELIWPREVVAPASKPGADGDPRPGSRGHESAGLIPPTTRAGGPAVPPGPDAAFKPADAPPLMPGPDATSKPKPADGPPIDFTPSVIPIGGSEPPKVPAAPPALPTAPAMAFPAVGPPGIPAAPPLPDLPGVPPAAAPLATPVTPTVPAIPAPPSPFEVQPPPPASPPPAPAAPAPAVTPPTPVKLPPIPGEPVGPLTSPDVKLPPPAEGAFAPSPPPAATRPVETPTPAPAVRPPEPAASLPDPAPKPLTFTKPAGGADVRPAGGSNTGERPPQTSFDVQLHEPRAGETYESISRDWYNSPNLAAALRAYNRNKPLTGGGTVDVPPLGDLRRMFPQLVGGAASRTASSGGEWAASTPVSGVRAESSPAGGVRDFVVPAGGMTMREVAAETLGTANRWSEIWELNKEQTAPNRPLPPGTRLRLPADARAGS